MGILLLVFLGAIGFIIGMNISTVVDKIILWKQKQNNTIYIIYRIEYKWDKWINGILVTLGFIVAFYHFTFYRFILTSIMCILAIFGARLNQRIRIIPNEFVLIILIIGIVNQLITNGFKGIGDIFLVVLITAGIFFLSSAITRLIFGSISISMGDIKLAMVLSFMLGLENVYLFLIRIVLFLLIYISIGLFTKTMELYSSLSMYNYIMGCSIIVMYEPVIMKIIEYLFST